MSSHTAVVLSDFKALPTRFRREQSELVAWLAAAHARAAVSLAPQASAEEKVALDRKIRKLVQRFGCSTDRVKWRNISLGDFSHQNWEEMRIFGPGAPASGWGAQARSRFYQEVVKQAFLDFYAEETTPPDSLIHVTCTGYTSPSGAQCLVADRGWGASTELTHAYHMSCYAALPALRIAESGLRSGKSRADLVHTELCTLHLDPTLHSPEQIVIQSLFSDGLIRYSARLEPSSPGPMLRLISSREEIVPNTENDVTWIASDHGMQITLSREVPERIAAVLGGFLERLAISARFSVQELTEGALFAIHPGGPRIVDQVQKLFKLNDSQVAASNRVLGDYGNMSSATLPYIWKDIVEDPAVPDGQPVVALAFGPGLTLSGAVLTKAGAVRPG